MKPLPPHNFHPAGQVISAAIFDQPPPFIAAQRKKRVTGRKAQGRRYERKGHEAFEVVAQGRGLTYVRGPWIRFETQTSGLRWCQPDGLVLGGMRENRVTILEFKYQHTFDAWYQLFQLYLPVVKFLFPHVQISCCEVVKWFDPATFCDPPARLAEDPLNTLPNIFNVHIWKP